MSRLNEVLKATQPSEYLIARVTKENVYSVVSQETTAIISGHNNNNLNNCKNIILICGDLVVGVGTIDSASKFDADFYSNVFTSKSTVPSWRAEVKFSNFIPIGQSIKDIFGNGTTIKKIVTVGYLNSISELNSLGLSIKIFFGFHIKQSLSSMGIE